MENDLSSIQNEKPPTIRCSKAEVDSPSLVSSFPITNQAPVAIRYILYGSATMMIPK